jgi:hypothetical protein
MLVKPGGTVLPQQCKGELSPVCINRSDLMNSVQCCDNVTWPQRIVEDPQ